MTSPSGGCRQGHLEESTVVRGPGDIPTVVGSAISVLGLGLDALGLPRWLAWTLVGMGLAILVATAIFWTVSRRGAVQDDPDLPVRDDRRDLADDLDHFAQCFEDWLDARRVQAPQIIEDNAKSILYEMIRVSEEEPERWEAHREASAYYGKVTRAEYMLGWRAEALKLFDAAADMGAVTPKVRERFEKPNMMQLGALPVILRKLSARLRLKAADDLLAAPTVEARRAA